MDSLRLTKDHTIVEQMARSGIITSEEARGRPEMNMLIRAVGINSNVEVDLLPPISAISGDIFVLCSDGLTEFGREGELGDIVTLHPLDEACQVL